MARKVDKNVAKQRIATLLAMAQTMKPYSQQKADSYVAKAWRLSTHNRIRLPLAQKRSFCRKCLSFWKSGVSVRIRINRGKKIYTCLVCRAIKRVPIRGSRVPMPRT
jgi:ribonuclease P protein subunit RPR2